MTLARFSLCRRYSAGRSPLEELGVLLLALMSPACIESPPTYSSPGQVPPFVISEGVRPRPDQFVAVQPGEQLDLFVQFVSVDVGEEVLGALFLDLESDADASPVVQAFTTIAPSPLGLEETRDATLSWPVPSSSLSAGCHTLTVLLGHRSAWERVVSRPIDPDRVAQVIWWLDVAGDEPRRPCPTEGETLP